MAFKFDMAQHAVVSVSDETGVVIGRAEYNNAEPMYLLRYKTSDGKAVEQWWTESALEVA